MPPYSGIAQQILNAYTNQANTTGGYSQGFSSALQGLADSEVESALQILERMGAPDEQQQQVAGQVGGPVGDTTYGQTGYLPATGLGEQGSAFAAYAATLPGLLNQELAQNAQYFAATHPPPTPSGGGSGGGSGGQEDSGGLTPSQQLALAKFEYDQEQDAMRWEFEMAKWEHELNKDELAQKNENRDFKRLMLALGMDVKDTKADNARQRRRDRVLANNAANANQIAVRRENRLQRNADNAIIATAQENARKRGEAASAYWGQLGSAGSKIFNDAFPDVGNAVPSGSPLAGGGGTVKAPAYRVAFNRVMAGLQATQTKPNGQWKYGFTNKQMRAKVNQILKSKGVKVPKRRKPRITGPPRTSPRPAPGRR